MANSVIQVQGLIIKEQKVSENDRLITVLTDELGVIKAFCSGSLKVSSKNLSATAFLSFSRLTVYKSRDTYKINDSKAEKIFWDLRSDFTNLSLASYFCEVMSVLAPKEENAEEYLKLILNCLNLLSQKEKIISPDKIKAIFELRCALYSGYMPDMSGCHNCGDELTDDCFFDILNGVCFCKKCVDSGKIPQKQAFLPKSVLYSIRYILLSPLKKAFAFNINDKSTDILCHISEQFLITQTGRGFDTLNYYKTYKI